MVTPHLIENRFAWWATHRVAPPAFIIVENIQEKISGG